MLSRTSDQISFNQKEVCESVDQTDTIRRWLAHMTDWNEMRTRIPYAVATGSGQSLAAYETM